MNAEQRKELRADTAYWYWVKNAKKVIQLLDLIDQQEEKITELEQDVEIRDHLLADRQPAPKNTCRGTRDGDCQHEPGFICPQLRDNEPYATGRHCPLDIDTEEGDD